MRSPRKVWVVVNETDGRILNAIRERGPMTRAQLADHLQVYGHDISEALGRCIRVESIKAAGIPLLYELGAGAHS